MALNVLAYLPAYPPGSLVGAWITTHQFLAGLARRGHRVEVSAYLGGGKLSPWQYELDGVDVFPRRPLSLAGVDVVVSHLGDSQEASKAARAAGTPSVRMAHGLQMAGQILDDDLVVANSQTLADSLVGTARRVVIAPPVWPGEYRTTPGDSVTLVNLSPDKGGYLLWKLAEQLPEVKFLGVRGHYGPQIRRRLPNVEVIDPTPDMAAEVYSRTRVLLMPSKHETYGRTAVEAACSGIPTLASPCPGIVEAMGDHATYAPHGALMSWVMELRRLLDPAEWEKASQSARTRADQLTPAADIERFCDEVEALVPARVAA